MAASVADIHIPGTDICKWPAWLRAPLVEIYPGIAAACAAGAVIHNDPKDLQQYQAGLPGNTTTPTAPTSLSPDNIVGFLSEGNVWLRAGEFIVGAILLYVGLRTMFPEQIAAVTGPVKTATKVVR
jgi:hypothetical protein